MNDALAARYQLLFDRPQLAELENLRISVLGQVGIGEGMSIDSVRELILRECEQRGLDLRADASLFLLINFYHMIVQPYSGSLLGAGAPDAIVSQDNMARIVSQALGRVLDDLKGDKPYSSHAVMGAVQSAWSDLAELFGWG